MTTTRNIFTTVIIIFLLSAMGTSLWLYEILKIKGWYSLNWLNEQLYSPYIAALIAVVAFITPFIINKQPLTKKIIFAAILLYSVSIICFEVGKQLCYTLYCRFCFWTTKDIILIFLISFMLFPFLGLFYWLVTHKFIKKNKKTNILFISLFLLSVIPLSLVTIKINTGFGNGTDWVDAVKMGYPIFWITMLLGFTGMVIAKQTK
jgi:hypothetical protein